MSRVARAIEPSGPFQETGIVASVDAGECIVRAAGSEFRARRAASCLLEPQAGDHVLLVVLPRRGSYVLAVLDRDESLPAKLTVEGDLELRSQNGACTVAGQQGVDLASGGAVTLTAAAVNVNAIEGNLAVDKVTVVGSFLRAEIEKVKMLGRHFDSVLERFSQKVKRSFRTVTDSDQVRAERIDYVAQKNMTLRGESTMVTAKDLVKVDGSQIHLG